MDETERKQALQVLIDAYEEVGEWWKADLLRAVSTGSAIEMSSDAVGPGIRELTVKVRVDEKDRRHLDRSRPLEARIRATFQLDPDGDRALRRVALMAPEQAGWRDARMVAPPEHERVLVIIDGRVDTAIYTGDGGQPERRLPNEEHLGRWLYEHAEGTRSIRWWMPLPEP